MIKRKLSLLLVACATMAATLSLSTQALAGAKINIPVYIGTTSFNGALGSVRNSTDATQYISCYISASSTTKYGYCYAKDSAGKTAACTVNSTDTKMLDVIAGMTSDSNLFVTFNTNGTCATIRAEANSQVPPKAH